MPIDIDECVAEILDIGHCILPDHFPRSALEECHQAFQPLLEDVAARIPEGNRGPQPMGDWAALRTTVLSLRFLQRRHSNRDCQPASWAKICTSPITARTHRYRGQHISTSTRIYLFCSKRNQRIATRRPYCLSDLHLSI